MNSNFLVGKEIESVHHFHIQLPSYPVIVEGETANTGSQLCVDCFLP